MTKVLFIADFFAEHLVGGGELNNEELICILKKNGHDVVSLQSQLVTDKSLNDVGSIIISNFINLKPSVKDKITEGFLPYVIYEHDHKYLKTRNPAKYPDFIAPKSEIINFDFYKNAQAILCQTKFHADIVRANLSLNNVVNLSGNLWSLKVLKLLETLSKKTKNKKSSIMNSHIAHKNTAGSIKYCRIKGIDYDLIDPAPPNIFLENISKNENLIFFPLTPETFSRIVVEARMMNMSLITNDLVGATKEPWFKKKGLDLIKHFVEKRQEIAEVVENCILK
jgi:hypothetical protein